MGADGATREQPDELDQLEDAIARETEALAQLERRTRVLRVQARYEEARTTLDVLFAASSDSRRIWRSFKFGYATGATMTLLLGFAIFVAALAGR
jgi:hypothetical protein